nr:hypothetical protein CFP56_21992 [Quercus suber]
MALSGAPRQLWCSIISFGVPVNRNRESKNADPSGSADASSSWRWGSTSRMAGTDQCDDESARLCLGMSPVKIHILRCLAKVSQVCSEYCKTPTGCLVTTELWWQSSVNGAAQFLHSSASTPDPQHFAQPLSNPFRPRPGRRLRKERGDNASATPDQCDDDV